MRPLATSQTLKINALTRIFRSTEIRTFNDRTKHTAETALGTIPWRVSVCICFRSRPCEASVENNFIQRHAFFVPLYKRTEARDEKGDVVINALDEWLWFLCYADY
jgi:hypothetical protein